MLCFVYTIRSVSCLHLDWEKLGPHRSEHTRAQHLGAARRFVEGTRQLHRTALRRLAAVDVGYVLARVAGSLDLVACVRRSLRCTKPGSVLPSMASELV